MNRLSYLASVILAFPVWVAGTACALLSDLFGRLADWLRTFLTDSP